MSAEQVAELLSALNAVYHSRFLACVGLTLAIYDWALVFPDELQTILQARWTIPKVLYYHIRIITPFGILICTYQLSNLRPALSDRKRSCVAWAFIVTLGMVTSIAAANALLALRLMALYRRKAAVVWFIRIFFLISYGITLGIVIYSLNIYYNSLFYSEIIQACATREDTKTFPAIFYGPSAFEFFVFALTAWRGVQDAKIITGTGSAPFLLALYRDGFICFFVMIGLRVWNIWIYLTQPLSSFSLGTQLMWTVNTILTTRVYMNLVWLAKKPIIEMTNIESGVSRVPAETGIRMRVTTFTEIHTDDWKSKRRNTMDPMDPLDDTLDQRRFWSRGEERRAEGTRKNYAT